MRIGVVADVQAATHMPDTQVEGRTLYFDSAPQRLRQAVATWSSHPDVHSVIQLGDIIDGSPDKKSAKADLMLLASIFDELPCPVHHVIGNHCLKSITRTELHRALRLPSDYYRVELGQNWRLVVLDTTELSPPEHGGFSRFTSKGKEADAYYRAHQGEPRMQRWNGGACKSQIQWLRDELASAEADGCRVIVASHHALAAGSARETHRSWTGDELASVCVASPAFVLALSGHDHLGGFVELEGKPFVTVEGLVESDNATNAFGWLSIYDDWIEIDGCGTAVTPRQFSLR